MTDHPRQPLVLDDHNVVRFKQNKIIRLLCDEGKINLNDIAIWVARDQVPVEDARQLMQLLGYSVSGYYDLNYTEDVPEEVYEVDSEEADTLWREANDVR